MTKFIFVMPFKIQGGKMVPYYIVKTKDFPVDTSEFSTTSQLKLNYSVDGEMGVSFNKRINQELKHFTKYDLLCEMLYKKRGRAYGSNELFNQCILIDEDVFYHDPSENILIVSASKDIFKTFVKKVNAIENSHIQLSFIDVNFESIIANQNALGVSSIWLGELPDVKINSLGMMGTQLESSNQYKQLRAAGATITNITIIFEYNGIQERIMITKTGGIILYTPKDESDALPFIQTVYKIFFKNN